MKTVPATPAGPVDEVRRADADTRTALAEAVGRSADLWRGIDNPAAPVPGLAWTAGETAAHVVGDMRECTEALTAQVHGGRAVADAPVGSPARLRTAVNDRHLVDVGERDPRRLADMLQETAASYLAAAAVDPAEHASVITADGLVLEPAFMTCLLLGEQLVHGLDIARATRRPWGISRDDALLVLPAVLALAPNYLRPARTRDLSISFELRMRGGGRYRMAIYNGAGVVTAAGKRPTASSPPTRSPSCSSVTGGRRSGRRSSGAGCAPVAASRGWPPSSAACWPARSGDRKRGEAGRSGSPGNNPVAIASAAKPGAAGRQATTQWRSQARRSRAQRAVTDKTS